MIVSIFNRNLVRGVLLAGSMTLALAACGTSDGGAPAGSASGSIRTVATARDCARVSAVAPPGPSHPTIVLVVDNTNSGPERTLPSSVQAALQQAQAAGGRLVVMAVNGVGANPAVVKDIALDPDPGQTSTIAANARTIAIACVAMWIASGAALPTRPGSDILSAVNAAIRRAPARIIVMSDGLNNVDPLNLNQIGYGASSGSVVAALQHADAIQRAATAIPVLWADLGVTAKPIPGVVLASLKQLWKAILHSANTPVTFLPDEAPAGAPTSNAPADVVKLPTATSTVVGCHTTVTLPTDLLFAPGSARLQGAADVLESARNDLMTDPGASAVIGGHTAAYGTATYRYQLSVARAQAVARLLEAEGVPQSRLRVKGYGSTDPAVNEFPGGRHDLAAAAANRRVVIDITREGCA
jgi:outer membrane protein OmpA-like peptidoglycan-associated protein